MQELAALDAQGSCRQLADPDVRAMEIQGYCSGSRVANGCRDGCVEVCAHDMKRPLSANFSLFCFSLFYFSLFCLF